MDEAAPGCRLDFDGIHAWSAPLDGGAAVEASAGRFDWASLLSQDERQRAARFHFDLHRQRYIAARGILRTILAGYLGMPPERLVFRYGANGKPMLARGDLHFNLSHCGSQLLVAVSSAAPLGADLEQVRPVHESMELAARFFSPLEVRALGMMAPDQYLEAFFRCWTRKEAFVKALGDGLSYGLDQFSVSLDNPPRIVEINGSAAAAAEWTVYSLAPSSGYIAAIVARQSTAVVLPIKFTGGDWPLS